MVASTSLPQFFRIAIVVLLFSSCLITGCQPLEQRLRGTSDVQVTRSQETSAAPSPEVVSAGWWNPFHSKANSSVERKDVPDRDSSASLSSNSPSKTNPLQRFKRFMGVPSKESAEPISAEAKITDSNVPRATMQENLDSMDQRLLAALRQPATRPGFRNTAAIPPSNQDTDPAIPGGKTKSRASEPKQAQGEIAPGESIASKLASSDPVAASPQAPWMTPPGLAAPPNPINSSKVEASPPSAGTSAPANGPEGTLAVPTLPNTIAAPEIPSNESPINGLVGSSVAGTSLVDGVQTKPWITPPAMLPVSGKPSSSLNGPSEIAALEPAAGSTLKTATTASTQSDLEEKEGVRSAVASSVDPSARACLTRAIQLLESQPEKTNTPGNRESLERLRQTLAATDPGYSGSVSSEERDQVIGIVERWSSASDAGAVDRSQGQASADRLLEALTRRESGDGMKIGKIEFCSEVFGYGAIEKVTTRAFSPDQGVLLYLELRNLREATHENGFQRKLTGRYELRNDSGQVVARQELPEDTESYESSRHDHFIVYRIYMPKKIAAGTYSLNATIEDCLHQRNAEGSIRFTIGEGIENR